MFTEKRNLIYKKGIEENTLFVSLDDSLDIASQIEHSFIIDSTAYYNYIDVYAIRAASNDESSQKAAEMSMKERVLYLTARDYAAIHNYSFSTLQRMHCELSKTKIALQRAATVKAKPIYAYVELERFYGLGASKVGGLLTLAEYSQHYSVGMQPLARHIKKAGVTHKAVIQKFLQYSESEILESFDKLRADNRAFYAAKYAVDESNVSSLVLNDIKRTDSNLYTLTTFSKHYAQSRKKTWECYFFRLDRYIKENDIKPKSISNDGIALYEYGFLMSLSEKLRMADAKSRDKLGIL